MEYSERRRERFSNEKQSYRPSVLVKNWNEDAFREEDKISDLLKKKSKGGLLIQRTNRLLETAYQPVELTQNHDGLLHDGDKVMLKWVGGRVPHYLAATPQLPVASDPNDGRFKAPCSVSGTCDSLVYGRSAFVIYREDSRIPNSIPLTYGEPFFICTIPEVGNLKLHTEYKTVFKYARKSKHQEVTLVPETSGRTLWRALFKNPQFRMEMEGQYVPINTDVIINHIYTNQHLALEPDYIVRTVFGVEKEISGHSHTDQYRVEEPPNYWQFMTPLPDLGTYDTTINLPGQGMICPENWLPRDAQESDIKAENGPDDDCAKNLEYKQSSDDPIQEHQLLQSDS